MVDCTINVAENEKKETARTKKDNKEVKKPFTLNEKKLAGTVCKKQVIHIKKK